MMTYDRYNSSFLLLGAISTLFLGLPGCREQPEPTAAIRPVKAVAAARSSGLREVAYSGVVRARIETALGFRISGKIVERLVNTGDRVGKNQVIARLDPVDLKLSEQSARSAVGAAQTRLTVARDSLDRAKALYPKGFIAKAMVDQRQLEADAARSALEAAESMASQAANASNYAELKSDKEGVVTSVLAEPGQVVSAGTPVVTLAQLGDMEIAIAAPEQHVARLSIGQPAAVSLWADPEAKAQGRVREISGAAAPASRTYAVRIAIDSPPPAMRLGMTAVASLAYAESEPSVMAPLTALTGREGDMSVFVVDPTAGTVSRRSVVVGGLGENEARIASGLKAGELIVSAGAQFLNDGQKVRLSGDAPGVAVVER